MADTTAVRQQAAHTTFQPVAAQQGPHKKAELLTKKYWTTVSRKIWFSSRKVTWQKIERGDRKDESNDSPEVPDKRDTSDIRGRNAVQVGTQICTGKGKKASTDRRKQSARSDSCLE